MKSFPVAWGLSVQEHVFCICYSTPSRYTCLRYNVYFRVRIYPQQLITFHWCLVLTLQLQIIGTMYLFYNPIVSNVEYNQLEVRMWQNPWRNRWRWHVTCLIWRSFVGDILTIELSPHDLSPTRLGNCFDLVMTTLFCTCRDWYILYFNLEVFPFLITTFIVYVAHIKPIFCTPSFIRMYT